MVAARDGSSPAIEKVDPLLALKFKTRVIPAAAVRRVTTVFKPLFFPPVVVLVVLAFIALDVWLFGIHGISQSLRSVIYDPTLILMLFAGVVLATTFHEIGHATGTRYGGAEPGVMGVGIYIVWPAFYTDITDSYRLGKAGRLRADLGGMYFNTVFALAVAAIYAATGFEPLLLLVVLQTFAIIQQSLPLLRLDGFYIISDLTGVPDMLTRIKPVLSRLIPGREPDPRVTELKPWVRRVVTTYIFIVVPLIALLFVVMLVHAPARSRPGTTRSSCTPRARTATSPPGTSARDSSTWCRRSSSSCRSPGWSTRSPGRSPRRRGRMDMVGRCPRATRRTRRRHRRGERARRLRVVAERRLPPDPAPGARHPRVRRSQSHGRAQRPCRAARRAREGPRGRPLPSYQRQGRCPEGLGAREVCADADSYHRDDLPHPDAVDDADGTDNGGDRPGGGRPRDHGARHGTGAGHDGARHDRTLQ